MKWFPTKARKESQESIKGKEKPDQGVVSEKCTEIEVHTSSASSCVQATNVEFENPSCPYHVFDRTEPATEL